MSEKTDSFQFMLKNRKVVTAVLHKTSKLSQAWEMLLAKLPETGKVVKFNTFKAYARFLNVVDQELDEKEKLEIELDKVRQEKESLEIELGRVRQNSENAHKSQQSLIPKRVDGWGVQLKGYYYYRLFKKIGGKVKWIHVGREWNLDLARRKIKEFSG